MKNHRPDPRWYEYHGEVSHSDPNQFRLRMRRRMLQSTQGKGTNHAEGSLRSETLSQERTDEDSNKE